VHAARTSAGLSFATVKMPHPSEFLSHWNAGHFPRENVVVITVVTFNSLMRKKLAGNPIQRAHCPIVECCRRPIAVLAIVATFRGGVERLSRFRNLGSYALLDCFLHTS